MKKAFLFIIIYLLILNNYSFANPLEFKKTDSISSYLSDDFKNNILPKLNKVSDAHFKRISKEYPQIYTNNSFTLYQNRINNKNILQINKEYIIPSPVLSMMIYLIENNSEYLFIEVFFIVSTNKISQIYSISGYTSPQQFTKYSKAFDYKPSWLYGTLALIYHDSSLYTDYDILQDDKSMRVASLIFIPDNKEYYTNIKNLATYPALNVINERGAINFLIKDRKALEYFNKYEVEPQNTFNKYLGGAVTMKAYFYVDSYGLTNIDGMQKIEILSIPALFQLESDKGNNRSYAYQKSYYKSLSIKSTTDYMRILDAPNGNEITKIEKVYYKTRDILYIPWQNQYVGEELWLAVILPKLNKIGYVLSSQADIVEKTNTKKRTR